MEEGTGTIETESIHSSLDNLLDDNKNFETSFETAIDSEEIYFGYGEEQFGRSQFSARGRVSSIKSENEFFDTVISACCTDENGQISAEKMLEVLLLNFSTGLDENKLLEMLLSLSENKKRELSHKEPKMNSNIVEEPLEKLLKLTDLLSKEQAVERRFSEVSLPFRRFSYSSTGRRDSLNSVSSLGILDTAEMSALSCESFEGLGGESNHRDLGELVNEIEEVQFQNKKIFDENIRLKAQMSQNEDIYHQLIQENEDLKIKVNNLQISLDKTKDIQLSHEELKTMFQTVEESRTNLKAKINLLEKENSLLQTSIKDLEEKLHFSNSAMEIAKQRELSLLISHSDQKEYMNELCQKCNELESQVKEYSLKCDEFELMVKELAEANESLRIDKKIADVQLAKAEEEITSLWETVNSCVNGDEAPECDGQLEKNSHNYFSPVTSLVMKKFSDINCDRLFSSTPIGYKFYIQGLSLCAEMNNALQIASGENLPTPFCGKYSAPLFKNQSESPLLYYHSPPRKISRLSVERSEHKLYQSGEVSSDSSSQDFARKRLKAVDISYIDWSKTSTTESSCYVSCNVIDQKSDQNAAYANIEEFGNAIKSSETDVYLNDKEKKAAIQEVSKLKSLVEAVYIDLQAESNLIKKINVEEGEAQKIETDDQQIEKQQHKEGSDSVISDLSPSDVREQINMEIKALRAQIVRSHALLTYLQTKEKSPGRIAKSIAQVTNQQNLSSDEEKPLFLGRHASGVFFQQGSFDDQVPSLYHNQFNRSNSSSTSHKSTPLHKSCLAQSCPILPSETSAVSRATQTEPFGNGNAWDFNEKKKGDSCSKSNVNNLVQTIDNESPIMCNQTNDKRFIQMSCASELSPGNAQFFLRVPNADHDTCHLSGDESPHSPYFPRNRTYSFLTAIKKGNPNLVDANDGFGHSNNKHVLCYAPSVSSIQPANAISHPYFGMPSNVESSCISHDLKTGSKEANDTVQENRRVSLAMDQIQYPDSSSISKKLDNVIQKKEVSIKENSALNMCEVKVQDDKASDKGFKMPQRNMRRGSGSGSPNSLSGIPRCPAFDFSEQDDVQSFPPSPQPESNISGDIKPEKFLGVNQGSDSTSTDLRPKSPVLRLKDANQKKREANKNKSLMPDLMENSETESAKGSFECEAPELPLSVEVPPPPATELAFPSLPDSFLHKLGVHKDSSTRSESFSEQEIESKFITLSLAFKTDKMTLEKRLELQKRQRDIAEKNVESEIKTLKDSLNSLNINCTSSEARDIISKMQNHVDIVQQSTSRMSGRAELYGSVQQEERISNAFEVLMLHVDNLKKLYDKEHRELEETRRILSDTKVLHNESGAGEGSVDETRKSLRSISLAVGSLKSQTVRRRASVSVFHQYSLPESCKNTNLSWTSGSSTGSIQRVDPRNRLLNVLCPFTSTSSVGSSSSSSSTYLPAPASPILSGISTKNSRRCSLPVSPARIPTARNISKISEVVTDASSHIGSNKQQDINEENIYTKRELYTLSDEQNIEDISQELKISVSADVEDSTSCKVNEKMEESVEGKDAMNSSDLENDVFEPDVPNIVRKHSLEALQHHWLSALQYHWNRTSGLNLFKCTISIVLVVLAVFCLLISFLPCQASSSETKTLHDILEIILHPYVYPMYINKPV